MTITTNLVRKMFWPTPHCLHLVSNHVKNYFAINKGAHMKYIKLVSVLSFFLLTTDSALAFDASDVEVEPIEVRSTFSIDTEISENTEWKRGCFQDGEFYLTQTVAFFENGEYVHSWKWYTDPNCEDGLKGEYWDKWRIVSIESSSLGPKTFKTKHVLLDGHKSQCKIANGLLSKKDKEIYYGASLDCNEVPTELYKTPFIFSGEITQSVEDYVKTLSRRFL